MSDLPFRRYQEGDIIENDEWEAMRAATDAELETVFRVPDRTSRAGYVFADGAADAAEACEDEASQSIAPSRRCQEGLLEWGISAELRGVNQQKR
jgi:hypothetical protein